MTKPTQPALDLATALDLLRDYGWAGTALALDHDDLELDEEALGYPDAPIARVSAVGALWLAVDAGRSRACLARFDAALTALSSAGAEALADWAQDGDREQADVEALFLQAIRALSAPRAA